MTTVHSERSEPSSDDEITIEELRNTFSVKKKKLPSGRLVNWSLESGVMVMLRVEEEEEKRHGEEKNPC